MNDNDFVLQLFMVHIVSYWVTVALYTFPWGRLNSAQWPKGATEAAKVVLTNQFVYTTVYIIPFTYYYPQWLPWWHIVWQLPGIVLLTDALFYTMHRIAHIKPLYKNVHVVHHAFNIPIAVGALYAHPLEHIFVNVFTAMAPLFMVRASPTVAFLWTAIASSNTVAAHSATEKDDLHGLHHRFHSCNFGVGLMFIDRLVGTWRE